MRLSETSTFSVLIDSKLVGLKNLKVFVSLSRHLIRLFIYLFISRSNSQLIVLCYSPSLFHIESDTSPFADKTQRMKKKKFSTRLDNFRYANKTRRVFEEAKFEFPISHTERFL